MTPEVVTKNKAALRREIKALERRIGLSAAELRDRASAGLLVGDEWSAFDELDNLEFLLDGS